MESAHKNSPLAVLLQAAIDTLLPPRCIATGQIVDATGMISPAFWSELSFIENPLCDCCGIPFSIPALAGTLCAVCIDTQPEFDRARSAVVYNDASRKVILDFKYGDRLQAVHTFAPWMQRAGAALLAEADYIVPVPLHMKRLWQRRFNQSALIAQELSKRTGKPCLPDGLTREKFTTPQKGLSRKERNDNVKNAFHVTEKHKNRMNGKNILIIDDVLTSGATLNECARVLKKSGAEKVFVLTIARVMKDEF